jgi:hypothetical protein
MAPFQYVVVICHQKAMQVNLELAVPFQSANQNFRFAASV